MAAEPADGGSGVAKRRWELENEVKVSCLGSVILDFSALLFYTVNSFTFSMFLRRFPRRFLQEVEDIDELLRWNPEQVQAQLQKKPWSKDNHFFKKVKISALALLKMAIHAKSGGRLEVMGMVQVCASQTRDVSC